MTVPSTCFISLKFETHSCRGFTTTVSCLIIRIKEGTNEQKLSFRGVHLKSVLYASKNTTFVHFKDNFFHSLLVPPVTQISVPTSKHRLLHCLKNDGCFSTNVGAYPRPDGNFTRLLLNTDKDRVSEKFHPNQTFHHYSVV